VNNDIYGIWMRKPCKVDKRNTSNRSKPRLLASEECSTGQSPPICNCYIHSSNNSFRILAFNQSQYINQMNLWQRIITTISTSFNITAAECKEEGEEEVEVEEEAIILLIGDSVLSAACCCGVRGIQERSNNKQSSVTATAAARMIVCFTSQDSWLAGNLTLEATLQCLSSEGKKSNKVETIRINIRKVNDNLTYDNGGEYKMKKEKKKMVMRKKKGEKLKKKWR
jgi:hypothetical protein